MRQDLTNLPFTGCNGVSPTGNQWWFTFPEHTGSQTIVDFLFHEMNITTCRHSHEVFNDRHHRKELSSPYHIVFVRNPYLRLLSSAEWSGIIEVDELVSNTSLIESTVAKFRSGVLTNEISVSGLSALIGDSCRPPDFVGRTANLRQDLHRVLNRLGYSVGDEYKMKLRSHCITSCTPASHNTLRGIQWYDRRTESHVLKRYASDFATFNFSEQSEKMWLSK
jgi:hypothetical protein